MHQNLKRNRENKALDNQVLFLSEFIKVNGQILSVLCTKWVIGSWERKAQSPVIEDFILTQAQHTHEWRQMRWIPKFPNS